ncbi:MAG TPA: pyridoxamine 5'-phosphate oxidase family protein [Actinomycetota bacterium]|nr:pyridoxamine 5'-phosphate oxidase family protein [Actinomycetota bacterium]
MSPTDDLSDAQMSHRLLSRSGVGALATMSVEAPGFPFASLTPFAVDESGDPILLLSALAEHTSNVKADPRASLLVADALREGADPLALERVTLVGLMTSAVREDVEELYASAHPESKMYAGFKDFDFYRLEVQRARYVGGFGRMSWIERQELTVAGR